MAVGTPSPPPRPQLRRFLPPHLHQSSSSGGEKRKWLGGKAASTPAVEVEVLAAYKKSWEKCSQATDKKKKSVESSAIAASLGPEEEERRWADTELQLQLLYLQRCWSKPFYGSASLPLALQTVFRAGLSPYSCVMFRGQVERKRTSNLKHLLVYSDRNVIVAINTESVHLFTDNSPRVCQRATSGLTSPSLPPFPLLHPGDHALPYVRLVVLGL